MGVLNLHHPRFLSFFGSILSDDVFQLLDGFSFLFPSCDIFFGLPDGLSPCRPSDTPHCSSLVPSNNADRYRKPCRTTGIRLLVTEIISRSCKQPEDALKKKMSLSFRLHRELFFQKPEGVESSGFLFSRPTSGALQNYCNPFNGPRLRSLSSLP